MSDRVNRWLEEIGLGEHAESFVENDIDFDLLTRLSTEELKELGLSVGHRRRFLDAVAKLKEAGSEGAVISSPSAPHGEAERRQLTVMFCDLVGSTELSQKLDAEDLREVNRAYQDACKAAIERYEGYIARYMGDGVLAYFGYPQAHEDDAERAVLASLGVVAAMDELNVGVGRERGFELAVRAGIATGPVVVGDLIGEGASQESAVVGATPNLAARLQGLAESNEVVISPTTHRLAGAQFRYETLGYREIKGIAKPIEAWRVIGTRYTGSRFEARTAAGVTPLVGRKQEIALLLDRWEQVREGEGQVVLLCGEPGIGKSRVAQTLLERTFHHDSARLRYQCSPYYTNSALYPVIVQIENAAGFTEDDSPEARLEKIESLLSRSADDVESIAPFFAGLLSIPYEHRYESLGLTPEAHRSATFTSLVSQISCLCRQRPVLMVFEDVHWADPSSLELLNLTIDEAQQARVMVLITFRPEFTAPWGHHSHVTSLTLNRFTRKLAAAMVDEVAGGAQLPDTVRDQIVTKTDGIPLFVEEMTKVVMESALQVPGADSHVPEGRVSSLAIPTTLQDSLVARLDQLGSGKEVAQIGAVLGREFSHELVATLAELSDEALEDALGHAVEAGLIFRRGAPPEAQYTFKHALLRDAAYHGLLKRRRQRLHGRLAALLEMRSQDSASETQLELLARHFTEAGETERAITYWAKAGQAAIDRYANKEAVGHIRKGLEILKELPGGPARQRHELELLVSLGVALRVSAGFTDPEVGAVYRRAQALCQHTGNTQQLSVILQGLRLFHMVRAEFATAREASAELLSLGERLQNDEYRLEGHKALACVCYYMGELMTARTHAEAVLALYNPVEHRSHISQYDSDPGVTALLWGAFTLWLLGYPDQARIRSDEAVAQARALSHPFTLTEAISMNARLWTLQRDPQSVSERAEEALALANEHGFPLYLGLARYLLGWAMANQGKPESGITHMCQAISALQSIGNRRILTWAAPLAEAYEKAELPKEGLVTVDTALKTIAETGGRVHEAELFRLKGEFLLRQGKEASEVITSFQRSLEIARHQRAKSYELRTAMSIARLLEKQGTRREARNVLVPVYDWFTEGFDTPDLCEAKTLLGELS